MLFRFQWQKLLEKQLFGQIFVCGYLLLITQIRHLCSSCSNLMYNDASCQIFFVVLINLFYLERIWKTKILLHLTRYLSCLFGLQKIVKNYMCNCWLLMGNCLPSMWFKRTNCKILHSNFSDFFRQSVIKIMGKIAIWAISYFYPLPPLNNVEKQPAKFPSSYFMGSQHCIGGRAGLLSIIFKIPIIFCHWL